MIHPQIFFRKSSMTWVWICCRVYQRPKKGGYGRCKTKPLSHQNPKRKTIFKENKINNRWRWYIQWCLKLIDLELLNRLYSDPSNALRWRISTRHEVIDHFDVSLSSQFPQEPRQCQNYHRTVEDQLDQAAEMIWRSVQVDTGSVSAFQTLGSTCTLFSPQSLSLLVSKLCHQFQLHS